MITEDYTNATYATCLYELFCKHDEAVKKYIKVGRKFWHYDGEKMRWRKLTVTYIRSGVMCFTFDDEPDSEQAWFLGCMNTLMMHAAEIYPYEIGDILSEWYPTVSEDFPSICKQCKWNDAEGNITVDVIWK